MGGSCGGAREPTEHIRQRRSLQIKLELPRSTYLRANSMSSKERHGDQNSGLGFGGCYDLVECNCTSSDSAAASLKCRAM